MVIHHWLASSFSLSFRIGSKRSRQDTNNQIWLVNASIGLLFLLQISWNLFCSVSNADLLSLGDRYKIYIEGSAWSVSEKYILACDSMTLVVAPKYYDFYSRVLMPMQHYWPVRDDNKCSSIKYAVDWGNSHKQEVFIWLYVSVMKFATVYHGILLSCLCEWIEIWNMLLIRYIMSSELWRYFTVTCINQTTVELIQHFFVFLLCLLWYILWLKAWNLWL